jgi:hypothetical protein
MKLWKADSKNWTVREVEGEPYPGSDQDGDTCYENTHFQSEAEALDSIRREAEAFVKLSARQLLRAQHALHIAEAECGAAAIALTKVYDLTPSSNKEESGQ